MGWINRSLGVLLHLKHKVKISGFFAGELINSCYGK